MIDESLEIALNGKRYVISLKPLHNEVKAELKSVFTREIDALELLKLYITRIHPYLSIIRKSLQKP